MSRQVEAFGSTARSTAMSVLRPFLRREVMEGVVDIGGPTLDFVRVISWRLDGTYREFAGHPQRTNLNSDEMREYLADFIVRGLRGQLEELMREQEELEHTDEISELRGELASTETSKAEAEWLRGRIEELEKSAEAADKGRLALIRRETKSIVKELRDIQRLRETPGILGMDGYLFDDVLLIQISEKGLPSLMDFASVSLGSGQQMVAGFGREMPDGIRVLREDTKVIFFTPLDLRLVEEGGQIQALYLTHETEVWLVQWIRRCLTFTSFLRISQRLRTVLGENKALQKSLAGLQKKIATMTFEFNQLKAALDIKGAELASIIPSLMVAILASGGIGLLLGTIVAYALGTTTILTQQQVLNNTLPCANASECHNVIGYTPVTIQQVNPIAYFMSGVSVLVGVFLAIMWNSKRWKQAQQKGE